MSARIRRVKVGFSMLRTVEIDGVLEVEAFCVRRPTIAGYIVRHVGTDGADSLVGNNIHD